MFSVLQLFGPINQPPGVSNWAGTWGGGGAAPGLVQFMTALVRLLIIVGGLYAFFNILLAGYGFVSAGDDPQKIKAAWAKIWQSLIGLLVVAGSILIAAIIGWVLFQNTNAILVPQVYGP